MIGTQAYHCRVDLHNLQSVLRPCRLLARDSRLQARSAASSHGLLPCQSGCSLSDPQSPHCRRLGHRCVKAYACRARCFPRWVQSACVLCRRSSVVGRDGTGTRAMAPRSCLSQSHRRSVNHRHRRSTLNVEDINGLVDLSGHHSRSRGLL